jgi:hypothetical protein
MPKNSRVTPDILDAVELLDSPGGEKLRLRFSGPFEGRVINWDATLFTPTAWAAVHGGGEPQRNIIEIGDEGGHGITLNICLKVGCIDRPTIRKAVLMVRQYKRLQHGRHEYG